MLSHSLYVIQSKGLLAWPFYLMVPSEQAPGLSEENTAVWRGSKQELCYYPLLPYHLD